MIQSLSDLDLFNKGQHLLLSKQRGLKSIDLLLLLLLQQHLQLIRNVQEMEGHDRQEKWNIVASILGSFFLSLDIHQLTFQIIAELLRSTLLLSKASFWKAIVTNMLR